MSFGCKTVTGWVKRAQIVMTDVSGKPVIRAEFNAMQKEVARLLVDFYSLVVN